MGPRLPVLFVSHGSPMNALSTNAYTQHLKGLGETLPRPSSILVVSAHWQTSGSRVLKVERPKQIYDFYGFPRELHEIRYEPTGAPEVAEDVKRALQNHGAASDDTWGLDHGTWTVLHHMYPKADIPVFQLSLDRNLNLQGHLDLARDLRGFRERGVLILGSGNITHNLREVDFGPSPRPMDWAVEFDEMIKDSLLNKNIAQLLARDPSKHALWRRAHPTLEHYVPLLYAVGASLANEHPQFPHEEIQHGSLSMRSVMY